MNLRQPLWMIAFGHLLGVLCILAGIGLVAAGWESWQWLLWWPVFHVIGSLVTSVGLHRYFSHAAFKTSRLWHNAMALYTPMLLIGSPIDWSVTHIAHHVHADTKNDPHIADWTYLVWKRYRKPIVHRRQLRRLMGDPTLAFVHRYGAGLWILAMLAIVAFLPWQFFVFGYGMALGSVHLIGAVHLVWNHDGEGARDWPLLEFLLPAMGEWNHKTHHEQWKRADLRTAWWHLDLGAAFIWAIRARRAGPPL